MLDNEKQCRRLYFLNSGLLKLCSQKDGNEFIMRSFSENPIFTGLDSCITQAKFEYSIITL